MFIKIVIGSFFFTENAIFNEWKKTDFVLKFAFL